MMAGSSPQVRGRRPTTSAPATCHGLIPAGAGQTRRRGWVFPVGWAHPRRCGADEFAEPMGLGYSGSSPQVRGRLLPGRVVIPGSGLIPAGAGQTNSWSGRAWIVSAHPRRCGADHIARGGRDAALGSSPQVRGRQLRQRRRPPPLRLIPAGAGQTLVTSGASWATGAHPRRCGADARAAVVASPREGSSPQVRGRRCVHVS